MTPWTQPAVFYIADMPPDPNASPARHWDYDAGFRTAQRAFLATERRVALLERLRIGAWVLAGMGAGVVGTLFVIACRHGAV